MKKTRFSAQKPCGGRELKMIGFVRIALLLTLGAMIVILSCLVSSGDPNLWLLLGPLSLVTVTLIWCITLSIGGFVMLIVAICRIARRLERGGGLSTDHHGQVWDRWMDGPDPLVP